MQLVQTSAGVFTAKMSKKLLLELEITFYFPMRTAGMLECFRKALTFVGVAALYISGDTDDGQGVDAGQAKEQREEPVHLDGQRTRPVSPGHPQIFHPSRLPRCRRFVFTFTDSCIALLISSRCGMFPPNRSRRIRKLKRKLSFRLLFLHNSLIEFRVWGDYLLIVALVKGNYATGLGSGSNRDTAHPAVPFPGDMDQLRSS